MRKSFLGYGLMGLLGLAALFLAILAAPYDSHAAPQIGEPAPEFTGTTAEGKEISLKELEGKIVVLEWTNHACPFVKKHYSTGNMQETQRKAKAMGDVVWLSVVSSAPGRQGHVTPEEARKITEEKNAAPTAKILDPQGEIGRKYGAKTTPHMFVIDKDGTLGYAGAIDDNPSAQNDTVEGAENYVLAALNAIQKGEEVDPARTRPYGCSVKYGF